MVLFLFSLCITGCVKDEPVYTERPPVLITSIDSVSDISVTPNPFYDEARVGFKLTSRTRVKRSVINSSGEIRFRDTLSVYPGGANEFILNMSAEPEGVYFLMLEAYYKVYYLKMIKMQ